MSKHRRSVLHPVFVFLFPCILMAGGCGRPQQGPLVIFLEGAGWYSSSSSVERGLRQAGYNGTFDTFSWSAFLGPVHDHLINARSTMIAERLAERIENKREYDRESPIHLVGLSAGTALILRALEVMDDGVSVDNVVLLSPSVSADHDLTLAMQHVRRNLYATSSPYDGILKGLPANADGKGGPPAGLSGFRRPVDGDFRTIEAYRRVINLPWQPSYAGFGWSGSHVSVTSRDFVASVICPRILTNEPYPLDRPIGDQFATRGSAEDP